MIIAKKSALEKALNYTYRDIVEGNNDVLLLWEFTVRPENQPPTIILEQQGLYKGLRGGRDSSLRRIPYLLNT